jgi:hypothetical protein
MSTLEVGKIVPATGTAITLGDSGDTLTVPSGGTLAVASGATLANSGTVTGFGLKSYAIIEEQTATTVNAGTFTSGAWRTRDLNTEVFDPDGIVSISSGQFTLGAGNYLIRWSASAFTVNSHKTRLYDVTGTASIGGGSSEWTGSGSVTNSSTGSLRITPSGSNVYEIQHQCSLTHSLQGFGVPAGFSQVEVFAHVEILKES